MNVDQFRQYIVKPALESIDAWSENAENLIIGTAAQESHLEYVHQIGGPALSLFQMEPATYNDIWDNYLTYREDLATKILDSIDAAGIPNANRLMWDLRFSAIMCRVHYRRVQDPLPDTVEGMAAYWKKHYNTEHGAGTEHEFIVNYRKYVGDS